MRDLDSDTYQRQDSRYSKLMVKIKEATDMLIKNT